MADTTMTDPDAPQATPQEATPNGIPADVEMKEEPSTEVNQFTQPS